MKCEDCKWWLDVLKDDLAGDVIDEEKCGQCHRKAPVPRHFYAAEEHPPDEESVAAYEIKWPFTLFNDWCGEFKKKK